MVFSVRPLFSALGMPASKLAPDVGHGGLIGGAIVSTMFPSGLGNDIGRGVKNIVQYLFLACIFSVMRLNKRCDLARLIHT